jgi:hypothetical protein
MAEPRRAYTLADAYELFRRLMTGDERTATADDLCCGAQKGRPVLEELRRYSFTARDTRKS